MSSPAPDLIHSQSVCASIERGSNRRPPSWGTKAVGLSKTRLCSGATTLRRRPPASWVIEAKSNDGSSPRRLNRNPPLPFKLPWHAPMLQPALEKSGTTSVRSPVGRTQVERDTRTSISAARSPKPTRTIPCPSASGTTTPLALAPATPPGFTRNWQRRVTSRKVPSASRRVTASCCRALRPIRSTRVGWTTRSDPDSGARRPIGASRTEPNPPANAGRQRTPRFPGTPF